MMTRTRAAVAGVAVVGAAAAVGAATSSGVAAGTSRTGLVAGLPAGRSGFATRPGGSTNGTRIVCDYARSYRGMTALRRAASSVAVLAGTAASRRTSIGGVPITITWVRVLTTLTGRRLDPTIELRQMGAAGVTGCGPLITRSRRYLAFLQPFRLARAGAPVGDQYVTLNGPQGLLELR
jgi:hypothetical protein